MPNDLESLWWPAVNALIDSRVLNRRLRSGLHLVAMDWRLQVEVGPEDGPQARVEHSLRRARQPPQVGAHGDSTWPLSPPPRMRALDQALRIALALAFHERARFTPSEPDAHARRSQRSPMSQPGGSRLQQALRYLRLAAASLAPRRRGSPPPARPLTYGEAELPAPQRRVQPGGGGAVAVARGRSLGRAHGLGKPFSTVRDTPAILSAPRSASRRSTWGWATPSSTSARAAAGCLALNRLGSRTISMDIAPRALPGRRRPSSATPVRAGARAGFLAYDGHGVPLRRLGRSSHLLRRVPPRPEPRRGPRRALPRAEARRPPVIAEPGEGHARHGHSRFDTEHYGVLENDLPRRPLRRARHAGFQRMLAKPYPDPKAITMRATIICA